MASSFELRSQTFSLSAITLTHILKTLNAITLKLQNPQTLNSNPSNIPFPQALYRCIHKLPET